MFQIQNVITTPTEVSSIGSDMRRRVGKLAAYSLFDMTRLWHFPEL